MCLLILRHVVVNRRWISAHWILVTHSSRIYANRVIDKFHAGSSNHVLFVPNELFVHAGPRASPLIIMEEGELGKLLSSDNEFSKDDLRADLLTVPYDRTHSLAPPHKSSLYISYV